MNMAKRGMIAALVLGALWLPLLADQWADDKGSAYVKGSKTISVGLSLFPYGLSAAFDYGFHPAISAGYLVGVMVTPDMYVPMIVRAAFHPFNLTVLKDKISIRDKFDVYAGLSTGFKIGLNSPFTVAEYIGARYSLSSSTGVYLEDCGGVGYINAGLTFKL